MSGDGRGPEVEIPVVCDVHYGSTRLVVRRAVGRVVFDVSGLQCCVLTVADAAAKPLLDALGQWLQ